MRPASSQGRVLFRRGFFVWRQDTPYAFRVTVLETGDAVTYF